jgi:hypothetical protein
MMFNTLTLNYYLNQEVYFTIPESSEILDISAENDNNTVTILYRYESNSVTKNSMLWITSKYNFLSPPNDYRYFGSFSDFEIEVDLSKANNGLIYSRRGIGNINYIFVHKTLSEIRDSKIRYILT